MHGGSSSFLISLSLALLAEELLKIIVSLTRMVDNYGHKVAIKAAIVEV